MYRDGLSAGSLATLKKQGGLMSDAELAAFESSFFAADAVRVRRWDDGGKIVGMATRTLGDLLELVGRQLQTDQAGYRRRDSE